MTPRVSPLPFPGLRRRIRTAGILLVVAQGTCAEPAATLPRSFAITGTASGTYSISSGYDISWTLSSRPADAPGAMKGILRLEGKGLEIRASFDASTSTRSGSWNVEMARIDLGRWGRPVLQALRPEWPLGDVTMGGTLEASGRGSFAPDALEGHAQVELSQGQLASPDLGLDISGVTLRLSDVDLDSLRTPPGQVLTFAQATFRGALITEGRAEFALVGPDRLDLAAASLRIFGGTVTVEPLVVPLPPAEPGGVQARVNVRRLALEQIALLLPDMVSEAHGQLFGRIDVGWSADGGLKLGQGQLRTERAGAADVLLSPRPGFFTANLPDRFRFLPSWTGPLADWFSIKNPAYEMLRDMEEGRLALTIETLQVQIHPEGDERGRSARVLVSARPSRPGPLDQVSFEINVSGPLDKVLKLGTRTNVSIRTSP